MGWDARLRVPRWVAERITREGSRGGGDRSAHVFREDDGGGRGGGGGGGGGRGGRGRRGGGGGGASAPAAAAPAEGDAPDPEDPGLDPRWRSTNAHYLASGFDRGHCAPAADFKGHPEALAASFVLSNVAPQVGPGMNRDYWARFERFVKTLATGAGGGGGGERSGSGDGEREVVVFTGPLYLPRRVKPGRGAPPNAPRYEMRHPMLGDPPRLVAVPTHFYKVALVLEKGKKKEEERKTGGDVNGDGSENGGGGGENGGGGVGGARARAIGAWVMPNAAIPPETPLTVFCVPLSALEDAAGGRFFQGVVDEEGGSPPSPLTSLAPRSAAASALAERLDAAALRWQARGRAAAALETKSRKGVSVTAEAAAALLPLSPKLAGLLEKEEEEDEEEEEEKDGGPAASLRASGAAELLLNPLPGKRELQQQRRNAGRGGGGRDASSPRASSSRPPPPAEPAPRWSWLFRNAGIGGGTTLSHICDVTECKLPAEDWYKSFPAGDKGAAKK